MLPLSEEGVFLRVAPDIRPDIQFLLPDIIIWLSRQPVIRSDIWQTELDIRSDIWQTELDIRPDTGYQNRPDIWCNP